jgi:hypothetical protein
MEIVELHWSVGNFFRASLDLKNMFGEFFVIRILFLFKTCAIDKEEMENIHTISSL